MDLPGLPLILLPSSCKILLLSKINPRGLARGLGITDGVSSPTFALVHEYRGNIPLYHFDMYRVSGWDDLYSTGFFDYLETGAVLAIEGFH